MPLLLAPAIDSAKHPQDCASSYNVIRSTNRQAGPSSINLNRPELHINYQLAHKYHITASHTAINTLLSVPLYVSIQRLTRTTHNGLPRVPQSADGRARRNSRGAAAILPQLAARLRQGRRRRPGRRPARGLAGNQGEPGQGVRQRDRQGRHHRRPGRLLRRLLPEACAQLHQPPEARRRRSGVCRERQRRLRVSLAGPWWFIGLFVRSFVGPRCRSRSKSGIDGVRRHKYIY